MKAHSRYGGKMVATAATLVLCLWAVAAAAQDAPADSMTSAVVVSAAPDSLPLPALAVPDPIDLWDTGASPLAAVLMSPLFPGWGQLYTDNSWRAALAYGSQMWFWSRMLTRDRRAQRARDFAATFEPGSNNYYYYNRVAEENWAQMRDFAWWSGASLLIMALDSYVGAHLYHFDDDPVPVPNRWDEIFNPAGEQGPGSTESLSVVVFQWRRRF